MVKPQNVKTYLEWARRTLQADWDGKGRRFYETVTPMMCHQFGTSPMWSSFLKKLTSLHFAYLGETGYPLLTNPNNQPEVGAKKFQNLVEKSYRVNILDNTKWAASPDEGWLTPENCFGRVHDIIRTRAVVKYVDGVERVLDALVGECGRHGLKCKTELEAKPEGYYAGHAVVSYVFEIPSRGFDTERVSGFVEVQVTTQIQEVIDQLTHKYYEQRRLRLTPEEGKPWQWRYDSPEFVVYYLGHILHYLEGMLVEVRDRDAQRRSS